jgi:hypothetical protein
LCGSEQSKDLGDDGTLLKSPTFLAFSDHVHTTIDADERHDEAKSAKIQEDVARIRSCVFVVNIKQEGCGRKDHKCYSPEHIHHEYAAEKIPNRCVFHKIS